MKIFYDILLHFVKFFGKIGILLIVVFCVQGFISFYDDNLHFIFSGSKRSMTIYTVVSVLSIICFFLLRAFESHGRI